MIDFSLVSPESELASMEAYMVVAPGDDGDFAAMPGSASLLSSLRPGLVAIYENKEDQEPSRRIFIAGGFADVSGKQCTILAEHATNIEDFNQAEIEQTIRNLQEDLGMAKDNKARAQVQENLRIALAKLEALTGKVVTGL